MKSNYITIAIPIYNEINKFDKIVEETLKLPFKKEIIIIDDGSTLKETKKILKAIKKKFQFIKIIKNQKNLGKAESIKKAIKIAKGDIFTILDSDGELNPKDIKKLYNALKKTNSKFVTGFRINKKKYFFSISNFFSLLAAKILKLLFLFFYKKSFNDVLCGYKMFYTKDFKNANFFSKRYGLETELLSIALKKNLNIKQIPVNYYPRSYNKGKKIYIYHGVEIIKIFFIYLFL